MSGEKRKRRKKKSVKERKTEEKKNRVGYFSFFLIRGKGRFVQQPVLLIEGWWWIPRVWKIEEPNERERVCVRERRDENEQTDALMYYTKNKNNKTQWWRGLWKFKCQRVNSVFFWFVEGERERERERKGRHRQKRLKEGKRGPMNTKKQGWVAWLYICRPRMGWL